MSFSSPFAHRLVYCTVVNLLLVANTNIINIEGVTDKPFTFPQVTFYKPSPPQDTRQCLKLCLKVTLMKHIQRPFKHNFSWHARFLKAFENYRSAHAALTTYRYNNHVATFTNTTLGRHLNQQLPPSTESKTDAEYSLGAPQSPPPRHVPPTAARGPVGSSKEGLCFICPYIPRVQHGWWHTEATQSLLNKGFGLKF